MDILVNGVAEPHPQGCSVADLLAARGHDPAAVVVERNGRSCPASVLPRPGLRTTTVWKLCSLWAAANRRVPASAGGVFPGFLFPLKPRPAIFLQTEQTSWKILLSSTA